MIANYHTHTWRCNHAVGDERQYVENALKAGLQILGFTDHTPYPFPESHYSNLRMRLELLPGYVETILSLREEYAGRIQIPLGVEAEYYPKHFHQLLERLCEHPVDYMILGQHFLGNEYDGPYCGHASRDEALLRQYVFQSCDAMNTGLFTYFAHPDLIHFTGSEKEFRRQMRDICVEANSCGIPLEFNLLGFGEGRHYPNRVFWELAAEEGCAVILGRDAHNPEVLLDEKTEQRALETLNSLGITPVQTVPLRPIR